VHLIASFIQAVSAAGYPTFVALQHRDRQAFRPLANGRTPFVQTMLTPLDKHI
jgi:hypothetical protein